MSAAHQQLALTRGMTSTVVLRQWESVRRAVRAVRPSITFELGYASASGDPEIPRRRIVGTSVFENRDDSIARQAIALPVMREDTPLGIETVESAAKHADP